MILNGPSVNPLSGGKPRSIFVFLHGVGSNGDNLIPLADAFADEFPDTFFVAPNGPEKFSGGLDGYQWFPYYDRTREQVLKGVEKASAMLETYTKELLDKFSLQPENLVLIGFSQGAMLSLQAGITMQDNCAGVIAFSGGLLKVEIAPIEVRSQPPVCLIHGEFDDVVPYQMSETTAKILTDLNVPSEFHKIKNLAHSIDMSGIEIAKAFLSKVLK